MPSKDAYVWGRQLVTGESNLCHERATFVVKEQFVPQVGFFLEEDLCLGSTPGKQLVPREDDLCPGKAACAWGKGLCPGNVT